MLDRLEYLWRLGFRRHAHELRTPVHSLRGEVEVATAAGPMNTEVLYSSLKSGRLAI